MPTIHIRHNRKLVLASEKAVVLNLHLVNDFYLYSVEKNITMTKLENPTLEVTSTN